MAAFILYIILCIATPYIFQKAKAAKYLSPVVLCYITGILMSFFPLFELNQDFKQTVMGITVLLAIPMILLSTNMDEWVNLAKEVSKAFAVTVFSMATSVFLCSMIFIQKEHIYYLSGMLTGAYVGSATNMNAVGLALNAPTEIFLMANIADIASTGIFLIIITSVLYPFVNIFLKKYNFPETENTEKIIVKSTPKDYGKSLIWAIGINACIIAFSFLLFNNIEQLFVIITLSIVSILLSKLKKKPPSESSFNFGYYLLLIFCVVIGSMVDISMLSIDNLWIVGFSGLILLVAVSINIFLAYLLKIHSELVIISLAASIYSVPFIGQIAFAINKKELITPGIICSLVGYALGNFLGIGIAFLVKWIALL